MPTSDGDGWVECACGAKHWGLHGAAGVVIVDVGIPAVLMQHRAEWTHGGATWGIPGGARDSHETAVEAALRELSEEWGVNAAELDVLHDQVWTDHGDWSYHTVIAQALGPIAVVHNAESQEARWVPLSEVHELDLHPGFASSWSDVSSQIETLLKLSSE